MTAEERLDTLEAENARLLDLAERQAAEQDRLCTILERQAAILVQMAGIEPPPPPDPESARSRPPCRVPGPARRYRRIRGGGAP